MGLLIAGVLFVIFIYGWVREFQERGETISSLRARITEYIEKAKARETELNRIIGSVQDKLIDARERRAEESQSLEKKWRDAERQIDALNFKLNVMEDQLVSSRNDRDVKDIEITALTSERDALLKKRYAADLKISLLSSERNTIFERGKILESKLEATSQKLFQLISQNKSLLKQLDGMRTTERMLRNTIQEAPLGFPSLLNALRLYDESKDRKISDWLLSKRPPARKASDDVKEETKKRRQAEYECRQAKCLLEYYRSVFPSIDDNDDLKEEGLDSVVLLPAGDDEDVVERYLSQEEYQQLPSSERNQIALDRFWERNKSKRLIGKLYERYVGYLYEKQGYYVDYFGITEGLSDLGRDLICNNGDEILLIQCKNWSRSKTIYEKHIFQFFGTMYQFTQNNLKTPVRGAFYTATSLSETARSFAKEFGIELYEDFPLKRYPMIKCNISRNGEGIYHLPFDLQYDATKINTKDGDRYCMTVAEAESSGFRRAYRWHGTE